MINTNSWHSLVLPWNTQTQFYTVRKVLVSRWIITSCEVGMSSHTELPFNRSAHSTTKEGTTGTISILTYWGDGSKTTGIPNARWAKKKKNNKSNPKHSSTSATLLSNVMCT